MSYKYFTSAHNTHTHTYYTYILLHIIGTPHRHDDGYSKRGRGGIDYYIIVRVTRRRRITIYYIYYVIRIITFDKITLFFISLD